MKIEEQVVSLELAKQLKELGVKQDSLWYYAEFKDNSYLDIRGASQPDSIFQLIQRGYFEFVQFEDEEIYSAFTVAELGEMLPATLECTNDPYEPCEGIYVQIGREEDGTWNCDDGNYCAESKRIADASAKMIVYLLSKDCHYDDKKFLKWKIKLSEK